MKGANQDGLATALWFNQDYHLVLQGGWGVQVNSVPLANFWYDGTNEPLFVFFINGGISTGWGDQQPATHSGVADATGQVVDLVASADGTATNPSTGDHPSENLPCTLEHDSWAHDDPGIQIKEHTNEDQALDPTQWNGQVGNPVNPLPDNMNKQDNKNKNDLNVNIIFNPLPE